MTYTDLIAQERRAFARAPLSELRATRVTLAIHAWGNSLQEKARAEAIEEIIHARLRAERAAAIDETPYGEELCRNGKPIADCNCC
jgi:hypothetical protein